jgi:hypothetical protein
MKKRDFASAAEYKKEEGLLDLTLSRSLCKLPNFRELGDFSTG